MPLHSTENCTAVLSVAFYCFSVSLDLSRNKRKQIILVLGSNANHSERMGNIRIGFAFCKRSRSSNDLDSILKKYVISMEEDFHMSG